MQGWKAGWVENNYTARSEQRKTQLPSQGCWRDAQILGLKLTGLEELSVLTAPAPLEQQNIPQLVLTPHVDKPTS